MLSMAPSLPGFTIQEIERSNDEYMVVGVANGRYRKCPSCQEESKAVHSWYERTPQDLPSCGVKIRLCLQVRRFFCLNKSCRQHIFCERLPQFLATYARRTQRMNQQLQHLAFVLGGELGTITTHLLAMPVSASTLLRLTHAVKMIPADDVRVLGIDDWAKRKRHHYGTILVDLERHRVVDLLPDRSVETLARWLQAHPEIEIVSRDRWRNYAEAVSSVLPDAIQVADRFHLIRNLVDILKRLFDRKGKLIRQAAQAFALEKRTVLAETETEEAATCLPDTQTPKSWQEQRFEMVKELQSQGMSQRAIARQLRMHRETVRRYVSLEKYPPRPISPQASFKAVPYLDYLINRWEQGTRSYKVLHQELVEKFGYQGSYTGVCRAMRVLVNNGTLSKQQSPTQLYIPRASPQTVAWLLVKDSDKLKQDKLRMRALLCEKDEAIALAFELAQSFCKMVKQRLADELDSWLEKAKKSGIRELKGFATSLQSDLKAVRAALIYEWSNGQVEGQVHRLKLVKRQMYGRANFALLRLRVLYKPSIALDHQK